MDVICWVWVFWILIFPLTRMSLTMYKFWSVYLSRCPPFLFLICQNNNNSDKLWLVALSIILSTSFSEKSGFLVIFRSSFWNWHSGSCGNLGLHPISKSIGSYFVDSCTFTCIFQATVLTISGQFCSSLSRSIFFIIAVVLLLSLFIPKE